MKVKMNEQLITVYADGETVKVITANDEGLHLHAVHVEPVAEGEEIEPQRNIPSMDDSGPGDDENVN